MKPVKLVKFPDFRLRRVCREVEAKDPAVGPLVASMTAILFTHGAWAVAAPQVGSDLRVIVVNPYALLRELGGLIVAINPVIIEASQQYERQREG